MQIIDRVIEERALVQRDTNAEYHAKRDYINASGLKTIIQKSPFHLANAEEKEPTPAMLFGTAYHTYVLEPLDFLDQYWSLDLSKKPEPLQDFRNTKNKEWKASQEAKNTGKTLISNEDILRLVAMKDVLFANPTIAGFLIDGDYELSHYHEDFYGARVRVRPDYLKPKVIVDLKTCEDASPEGFARQCHNFGYHIQAALYTDVLESIYGVSRKFVFICQEKTYPYAAQAYAASDSMIEQGRYEYSLALETYKKCLATGEWPGYEMYAQPEMRGLIELDLPTWAYRESKLSA
ncbi:PD-(D/E)XK nuclease-like domain-containing protein [Rufibacter quisquiliarum]|uniref:Exodeoxyribonuclease VIII n=1 Tax=Rufibacter quisquiliarum TaxID=1549639 RepID=A0A839GF86_9BACT|nr:PD-(D/E)XK nuclease-like domain-containing protein [Rufibacter quisquiliarum]MBA9078294.1 exodeoxyribonuclease VIII [Rufibacter quisquiliarum]